jgi:ribosomal protein S13
LKFEQVLQIYWTKGFLVNGQVLPFESKWRFFGAEVGGFGHRTRVKFVKRFELTTLYHDHLGSLDALDEENREIMNKILSKMTSINHQIADVENFNLLRLYLIKSFRGKAQAIGKPSHGQRTWSNAWTAYKYNKHIRTFIATTQRQIDKDKREEKINYKFIQKIKKKSASDGQPKKVAIKPNAWF